MMEYSISGTYANQTTQQPAPRKRPRSMDWTGRRFFLDGMPVAIGAEELRFACAAGFNRDDVLVVGKTDPRAWEGGAVPSWLTEDPSRADEPRRGTTPPQRPYLPATGMGGTRGYSGAMGHSSKTDGEWLAMLSQVAASRSVESADGATPPAREDGLQLSAKRRGKITWDETIKKLGGE